MRKVDDKRVHKALTALAIGGPAGSDAQMMSLLELIDLGERRANESAECVAFRDHPLPNPSVKRRNRSRRFLCSTNEDLSGGRQRTNRTRSWIARSTRSLACGTMVSAARRGEK